MKKNTGINIDAGLLEWMQERAEKNGQSVSSMIEVVFSNMRDEENPAKKVARKK